ncbi:MAG: hypothetical protein ABIQ92_08805 [Ornithinibacter sp.]
MLPAISEAPKRPRSPLAARSAVASARSASGSGRPNNAYSGDDPTSGPTAADTPFRFDLTKTTWTVNPTWAHVEPGKTESDMKKALYEGDSETLNVYAADIGGGLLAPTPAARRARPDPQLHGLHAGLLHGELTPGQAKRMSDAWQAFRAGGNG